MADQDPPHSSPASKISILQNTIEQLHVTRLIYEEQAAFYGPLNVPPYIKNAIQQITDDLSDKEAELQEVRSSPHTESVAVNSELKRFWEPFVCEGVELFVPFILPEDAAKTKITVLALEMQAVFNMYRLLLELFANTYAVNQIRLQVSGVMRQTETKGLTTAARPHLIVIGAPGANPLSNYLLAQFKGISAQDNFQAVGRGYVFRVEGDYLGSPFIVSDEALNLAGDKQPASMPEVGIYDLRADKKPGFYPRTFQRYDVPSPSDQDCALIVTGWASLPGENRVRRVVVIAGHSRHSTLSATAFAVTNEAWAAQINGLHYFNTETIIGWRPDSSSGQQVVPSILDGPREIYKHSTLGES
jgi:hypothetical protein